MSWTDPETKSTGNLITAAYWNQMLGPSGNQVLTAPGVFTTAGDIIYGTGDNATTRLASSGGGGKFLQMNGGATAPAWVTALTSLVADTTPQLGGFLDANGNYIQMQNGDPIASESPTVIDTDGDYFICTGTTNFSAFTVAADRHFFLEFAGVLTITHGAGTIDLPGGANITTAASDVGEFVSTAANVVTCVNYTRASGKAVIETVTSVSGSTGAVADGDIDHDSLANFAANEHYTQANITTIGTVTSGTISTGAVIADPTMTLGSDADGDMYYRASGVLTRLAKGSDDDTLMMNGNVPNWEAVAGGGGGSGLTEADSWILTTPFTGDATPIATNLAQTSSTGFGCLGTGMSESSGIFTFPSTGYWAVLAMMNFRHSGDSRYLQGFISATTNNTDYSNATEGATSTTQHDSVEMRTSIMLYALLDVTNTTNVKVRFVVDVYNASATTHGATDNQTSFHFLRLGDT